MTARDLAGWAADAFAGFDLAATHRIVTATTGPGPLPDYVSARVDSFTGIVRLPRPVGVVLARAPALAVVRRVLLTRNALLVEAGTAEAADRVRDLAALAEAAGAPAGVLQVLDEPASVDVVLDAAVDAPEIVMVEEGTPATLIEPDAVVLGYTDIEHAIRAARGILRETGGDRIRVYSNDPDSPLRVAAALPVTRVAAGDLEMPPSTSDELLRWTHITTDTVRQPWAPPSAPIPAYPRASHE